MRQSGGHRRGRSALLASTLALAALVATGCSSYRVLRNAELAEARQDWDEAVVHYLELTERDAGNVRWRTALLRARLRAAQEHFQTGRRFHEAGVPERALVEYQRAVQLDPTNQYAQVEYEKLRRELEQQQTDTGPTPTLDEMKRRQRDTPAQPPTLNPRSESPISLDFPEPQSMFAIYQALGKAFGINILFDPQLRDQDISIVLRNVTAQSALETLMRTAGHFYKVIDEQTILVAQDTQQNRRTYEDLVIQTFYLSNADVKDAVQLLRSLISSRNIATNEQLNAVTIRDTADKVKIAQRIIETIDKARSEVVVDIELIQVNTTKLRQLGVSFSENRVTQAIDLGEEATIRLPDLRHLTQQSFSLTIPSIIYDFVKSSSDAQLLAKPQVRVTDGEQVKLRIGDQVPIPVTSFNSSQTVGGNIVPVTSFQYKDVGINIDLEPRVHHNKEVTLKLSIEVSQITNYQDAGGGQRQPVIGTRTIESTIRLKDGETNFLAGLIRTDESTGESGIPGLSDIPILGKLFSRNSSDVQRTDVMLTLTPHIVRTADVTEEDLLPIWVGTEANMTFRGGSPRVESESEGPFDDPQIDDAALEEQLRRRLEEESQRQPGQTDEPEGGFNLVPGGLPSSPFDRAPADEGGNQEKTDDDNNTAEVDVGTPLDIVPSTSGSRARGGGAIAGGSPAGGVRLTLQPSTVNLGPGETFRLAIAVDARVPVSHLPATLSFDPSLLAVERVDDGGFLGGSGQSQVLADTSSPGTIVLGASRLGQQPGVAGAGTLATITFRTVSPGHGSVRFADRRALGPELVEIAGVQTAGSSVEVSAPAPEPPPTDAPGA